MLLHLLRHLDREKYPSRVLLPEDSTLLPLLLQEGIPVFPISEAKETSLSFSAIPSFRRFFQENDCAVLQTHGCLSARAAARTAGVPILLNTLHCDVRRKRDRFFTPLYRAFTTLTVAVSPNAKEGLLQRGIPEKETALIENGFCPIGRPDAAQRQAARQAFGIKENWLAVGLAARFAPVKGHESLLYATKKAVKAGLAIHLFLAGEGEEQGRIASLGASLGIAERMHFTGFLTDMTPFYHAMDVHLSCSLDSETASLSLAEGMSAALPTVAAACPGNKNRVGQGGMLYPPGDSDALAACLLRMGQKEVRAFYALRAQKRAETLPTDQDMAKAYEGLYSNLTAKKG